LEVCYHSIELSSIKNGLATIQESHTVTEPKENVKNIPGNLVSTSA
jgi:hypothetical protein